MTDKYELLDEELESVSSGRVTYTWDGKRGTIGKDGNNIYILVDKEKYLEYYNSEGYKLPDSKVLRYCLEHGIAKTR